MRREYRGGVGVPGLALGPLLRVDRGVPLASAAAQVSLEEAFAQVSTQLDQLATQLRADGRSEAADIAEANRLIAEDPDLYDGIKAAVQAGTPVAAAVQELVDRYAGQLAALPDPTLAGRATDVRAVGRRLLTALAGFPAGGEPAAAPGVAGHDAEEPGVVLVGYEVAADDLLSRVGVVSGVVSVVGGAGAHTAIVARGLGVAAVFGVDPRLLEVPDREWVLVDGDAARVVLDPAPPERADAAQRIRSGRERAAVWAAERDLPAQTRDGYRVNLYANVSSAVDNTSARERAAEGIGLVRTEMPFLAAARWPTYAEHMATLGPLVDGFDGRPVTVRTLDFADDKLPPFLRAGRVGPLGRGLPLLLAEPAAFADQFRAIVDAGAAVDLRIMIPMVASTAELLACRQLLDGVLAGPAGPLLGAMIELPEAVAVVAELARYADFFSIGSNDLTAAILRLERRDPALTPLRAGEPEVLQAIAVTAAAAASAGIPVSVCGDAAAEPALVPLLIGVGCGALSVAPAALDQTRAIIRGLDYAACVRAAGTALAADSLDEVVAAGRACIA